MRRETVGVLRNACSITSGARVSRTSQAPATSWPELASTFGSNASRNTLSRNSDQDNKPAANHPIERISVLGAGTMGHGIAQVAAAAGYDVVMRDIGDAAVQRGLQSIVRNLSKGVQLGKVTEAERNKTQQRIRVTTDMTEISESDLVIEAAPEKLELKQNL